MFSSLFARRKTNGLIFSSSTDGMINSIFYDSVCRGHITCKHGGVRASYEFHTLVGKGIPFERCSITDELKCHHQRCIAIKPFLFLVLYSSHGHTVRSRVIICFTSRISIKLKPYVVRSNFLFSTCLARFFRFFRQKKKYWPLTFFCRKLDFTRNKLNRFSRIDV